MNYILTASLLLSNIAFGNHNGIQAEHEYGALLPNSCEGKADGEYWFLLSAESTDYEPVKLLCSNGYIILDVELDSNLVSYFSSFEMWHYQLGGPSNTNPTTWEDWFLPENDNTGADYLISPDCAVCDEDYIGQVHEKKTSYWMTGNLAKLHWPVIGFNECDMDYETYQCYDCISCMQITVGCEPKAYSENTTVYTHSGICGVTVQESTHEIYDERHVAQRASGMINYKPSIGTSGKFCMCYAPDSYEEYALTEDQEKTIELRQSISHARQHTPEEAGADDAEKDNLAASEETVDLRDSNVIYLTQNDFLYGTYRITTSGTYIISEDIIFNFNKDDDYWPTSDQVDEYPGAAQYRDPYHMGFFAGIAIETDYVTIDLNDKTLKMSLEFYYQQRWFAIIELGNQQFLPGQGPAFFGPDPVTISDITIKNGVLGRTSHFGIHGNFPTGLTVENVHIRDFVTHGLQLNGWNTLVMNNIEVGPSSTIEYLRGDYGHARIVIQRLRAIESDMTVEGTVDTETVKFGDRDEMTITDVADNLEYQMEMAYDYAMNRANGGLYSENDYINPKYTSDEEGKSKWAAAKKQFVHESGLPSASSITGLFLNFEGASVFSYTMYTTRQSKYGTLNNIYIHDIYHDMVESMRISRRNEGGQLYPTPWNSDIPAEAMFGGKDKLFGFYTKATEIYNNKLDSLVEKSKIDMISGQSVMNDFEDSDADSDTSDEALAEWPYVGSVMSDAYFSMSQFSDDWGYLGFLEIATSDDDTALADWAFDGELGTSEWVFGCNQDIMGHSGKGLLGLRIDGVAEVELDNIVVENLYQYTPLGSYACGNYYRFTPQESGGHFKQSEPMQWGFSANDLQAVSIIASTDLVVGNLLVNNLKSDYSQAYGISFWTGNDITFKEDALVMVKNIEAGIQVPVNTLAYDDKPNRAPEVCAVRLEIDDTSDYYQSYINVNDELNGASNIISCNLQGHTTCLGDADADEYTMFGNYYESFVCEDIKDFNDLTEFNSKTLETSKQQRADTIRNSVLKSVGANKRASANKVQTKEEKEQVTDVKQSEKVSISTKLEENNAINNIAYLITIGLVAALTTITVLYCYYKYQTNNIKTNSNNDISRGINFEYGSI